MGNMEDNTDFHESLLHHAVNLSACLGNELLCAYFSYFFANHIASADLYCCVHNFNALT
jgi:hypothetical protein